MPWRATRQRSFWTGRFMAGVAIQWNIWYNLYIYTWLYTHIYICIRICICICIWYDNICIYVNRQSMYSNICNRCMKKYEQMDNDGHKKNDRTNNH
jgi:hypothetical protein